MDASYKFSWLVQLAQLVQHRDSATHPPRPAAVDGLGAAQPASSSHLHRLHPILRRLAQPLTAAAAWPQLRPASSVVRSDGTGNSRLVLFFPPSLRCPARLQLRGVASAATAPKEDSRCGPFRRPQRGILAPSFKAAGQTLVGHRGHVHLVLWSFGILDATTDTGGTWVAR